MYYTVLDINLVRFFFFLYTHTPATLTLQSTGFAVCTLCYYNVVVVVVVLVLYMCSWFSLASLVSEARLLVELLFIPWSCLVCSVLLLLLLLLLVVVVVVVVVVTFALSFHVLDMCHSFSFSFSYGRKYRKYGRGNKEVGLPVFKSMSAAVSVGLTRIATGFDDVMCISMIEYFSMIELAKKITSDS